MVGTIIDDNNFINCTNDFVTTGNYSSLSSFTNNTTDGISYDSDGDLPTATINTMIFDGTNYEWVEGIDESTLIKQKSHSSSSLSRSLILSIHLDRSVGPPTTFCRRRTCTVATKL